MHIRALFETSNFEAFCEENEIQSEENVLKHGRHRGRRRRIACKLKSPPLFYARSDNCNLNSYQELWQKHETKWNDFSTAPPVQVFFDTIPFPPCDEDLLEFIAKFNMLGRDMKAAYRVACRRFHPDKFMQNFGAHIVASDTGRILTRLTSITQSVNSQYATRKRLKRSSSEPPR